jgi:hypothetical protein
MEDERVVIELEKSAHFLFILPLFNQASQLKNKFLFSMAA